MQDTTPDGTPIDEHDGRGLDRRALIKRAALVGGAAWTAPVIIDSLASPAGAATACANGKVPTDPTGAGVKYQTAGGPFTYITRPGQTSVLVRAWGGGGAGASNGGSGGGGGGGGGYASSTITVTECTEYSIYVGAGGTVGNPSGLSSFGLTTAIVTANGGTNASAGSGGAGGTAGVGTTTFAGAAGAGNSGANGGAGGGSAGSGGSPGAAPAAGPGTPPGAAGGAGGGNGAAGTNGSAPGGGGGGAGKDNTTPGSGAAGAVWVGI